MSSHGGDDENEGWVDDLQDALDDLGLFDEDLRSSLVDGVREAIGSLESTDPPPTMTVLDGGRTAPPSPDQDTTPNLEVLDGEREVSTDPARTSVDVQVVRPARRAPLAASRDRLEIGHIRLAGDPDVWQTLRHGSTAASYRVHCDSGELHLAVDGELIARLERGQSTDVQGAIVRARACGDSGASGRFRCLSQD